MAKYLTALSAIHTGDFTIRPFVNHKTYRVTNSNYLSRGYSLDIAKYYKYPLPVSASSKNIVRNATTSSRGVYSYISHNSIKHLFYRRFREESYDTFEGHNPTTTEKSLYISASIISTPYFERGEKIHPTSVILTSGSITLYDDGYGNLYDPDKVIANNVSTEYLDYYLGFEDLYTETNLGTQETFTGLNPYRSYTHIPDAEVDYKNVRIEPGIVADGYPIGTAIGLKGVSYARIKECEEINYDISEDFTISFYIKTPVSQSITSSMYNTILGKNRVIYNARYGTVDTFTRHDRSVRRTILSSSYDTDPTTQYPFHFEIANTGSNAGKVFFRRSDGNASLTLTSSISISDNNYHHVSVVKSGSLVSLYVDGTVESSENDVPGEVYNRYEVFVGAGDRSYYQALSGSIDELRFYSTAISPSQVSQSLSVITGSQFLQTNRVGNVFYRQGIVAVTSLEKKYHDILSGTWQLLYKNTHTTYEYETVCKIKKGTFNGTMNPSARKSVKSQQLNEDFITGTLSPYITTIGLYDKHMNLLAVGKLGRPIKTREDVDLNFIVRWDY